MLDEELCYQAMTCRDARFDGRFFIAVKTTGVYCRPICPARTPLRRNVRFFACAAAAEAAGFRPCRRCRPETAPGSPTWHGPLATVSRALRLIEQGALDGGDIGSLAAQLGVGERYLRRLFARHLGTSPHAVAASRRAHFARALLDATLLPMTQVALASGFGSVRQFNDVVRSVFGRAPSELRRHRSPARPSAGDVRLRLSFRPPLAWQPLLAFVAARAIPGVEEVDLEAGRYRRLTPAPGGGALLLEVGMAADGRALELDVSGGRQPGLAAGLLDLVRRVRRLFDLDADPLAIAARLGSSRLLAPAQAAHPGLRVPGAWDRFETLVRAMLGQQISVAAATTLAGRLVERCGGPVECDGRLTRLFPAPGAVAEADLAGVGMTSARADALRQVAAAVARDPALLAPAPNLDALVDRLCRLPGIGPWTAHYLAMRAFDEPDAFPAADLGLRRAAGGMSAAALEALAESWRPWRAYAAISLWTLAAEDTHDATRSVPHRLAARRHRARGDGGRSVRPRLHRI
jgi:AraC family transcriptional regulator of adaptative response / DNA-3-methyladenine glycosylase II